MRAKKTTKQINASANTFVKTAVTAVTDLSDLAGVDEFLEVGQFFGLRKAVDHFTVNSCIFEGFTGHLSIRVIRFVRVVSKRSKNASNLFLMLSSADLY